MLPAIAASISASVGLGFLASSAAADINCPDWQYPHCGTCSAIQASCSAWLAVGDRPSIVVTFLPTAAETCVTQDRVGAPSRCTVQAPHCDRPQPNFVPVRPIVSRMTQSSGMSGGTSTLYCLLFTVRAIMAVSFEARERSECTAAGGLLQ